MRIEICIPAYNEERIIADAARAVLETFAAVGVSVTVTVIDNASTDTTAATAGAVPGVRVLAVPTPGKGAAVITAAQQSEADIFGFIDADLSAHPTEIIPLLPFIEGGSHDIVIGSRLIDTRTIRRGLVRTVFSRLFNRLRKYIVGIDIEDTQCGLKLMNVRGREILAVCEERGWFFDMEFLARAERSGLRIHEVPIEWDEERFPGRESKLRHVRDGIEALFAMRRIRRAVRANR